MQVVTENPLSLQIFVHVGQRVLPTIHNISNLDLIISHLPLKMFNPFRLLINTYPPDLHVFVVSNDGEKKKRQKRLPPVSLHELRWCQGSEYYNS